MTSASGNLWPYLLLAACWSAACGWLLLRVQKAGTRITPANPESSSAAQTRPPHWERDTQAGRM